jgi:hypothetical protein
MRPRIIVSASVMLAALAVSVWLCRRGFGPEKDLDALARLHVDADEANPFCIRSITPVRAGGSLRVWFCSSMGLKARGHIEILDVESGREVMRREASSHVSMLQPVVNLGDLDGDTFDDVLLVEMKRAEIEVSTCSGLDGHAFHRWTTKTLLYGAVALPSTHADARIRLAFTASSHIEMRSIDDGTLLFSSENEWDAQRQAVMSATSHVLCPCGDVDTDGRTDFCVSVCHTDQSAPSEVWIVSGESGRILGVIPEPEQTASFGCSLAQVGDIDGDGRADIAVGSEGAAFVISPADGRVIEVIREPAGGDFGCLVHAAGDFDGDGRPDLFVGAITTEPGHPFGVGPYFEIRSGRTGLSLLRRNIAYDILDRNSFPVAELGSVSKGHDHQVAVYQPLFDDAPMFSWLPASHSAIDIISGVRASAPSH